MKIPYSLVMFFSSCFGINSESKTKPETMMIAPVSIYTIKLTTLSGDTFNWDSTKGKKILIVNTASKCGYTPQYDDLEKLYQEYKDKLVILGFPCNDFGGQEPGDAKQIQDFCRINYGVTFPIMQKVSTKGKDQHPMYKWLTDPAQNGWNTEAPKWNFGKYLINEKGELMKFYGSGVKPFDKDLIAAINS